jgi:hypothetical protein
MLLRFDDQYSEGLFQRYLTHRSGAHKIRLAVLEIVAIFAAPSKLQRVKIQ